ncbi:MAG: hypothetical protein DHS20C04_13510 [Hyphococcus sp.]|nr:MAG: hypothetical protein DHS20C04_13510 [Marinicaulis sp.]
MAANASQALAHKAPRERLARLVHKGQPAHKVRRDRKAQQDRKAMRAWTAWMAISISAAPVSSLWAD